MTYDGRARKMGYGTVGSRDAAVERTGTYSQGELRSKRGCPGVQRVP